MPSNEAEQRALAGGYYLARALQCAMEGRTVAAVLLTKRARESFLDGGIWHGHQDAADDIVKDNPPSRDDGKKRSKT